MQGGVLGPLPSAHRPSSTHPAHPSNAHLTRPGCASRLRQALLRTPGVGSASVDFATRTVTVRVAAVLEGGAVGTGGGREDGAGLGTEERLAGAIGAVDPGYAPELLWRRAQPS